MATRRTLNRVAVIVLAASALAGCERPIFIPDEPRSQYDRIDALHDRRAPTFITDEFGNRRPNLTGRLSGLR